MENGTYISDEVNELFGIQTELTFCFPSITLKKWEELGKEIYLKEWLEREGYKIYEISPVENTLTSSRVVFNQKFNLEDFINHLETEYKWENQIVRSESIWAEVSDGYWGYILILQDGKWKLARQNPFPGENQKLPSGVAGMNGTSSGAGVSGFKGMGYAKLTGLSGSSSYAKVPKK